MSSAITLNIPANAAYMVPASLVTVLVVWWQGHIVVGGKRKAAKIPYPQMYATIQQQEASPDALKFNCAQRAHQNSLEELPIIFATSFITALTYPTFAAAALGTWGVSRVLYTLGYITGDPVKRNTRGGAIGLIASLLLIPASIWSTKSILGY